jgi:hypothetical protein
MIVPYLPLIFLMIVVFGQPHDRCRNHSGTGAAVTWSSERAPASLQRSPKATIGCARGTRTAASPIRVARTAAPNAKEPPAKVAVSPPAGRALPDSNRTTINQVTAAVAVVKRLSAYQSTAAARANNTSPLVVLLMVRPEIKSVSDLTGKEIAMDGRQSVLGDRVLAAISQAGATGVKLSGGRTKAVNRLLGEQVPAAVLALVSPDAAESFPDVAGFKIFRIPSAR